MNTTNTNPDTNSNATSATATKPPYRATLHPILRTLWNIPHVIQIPDPMPAPLDVIQLLQQHLDRRATELAALDFDNDEHKPTIAEHKWKMGVLKHKIEEVHRAFPDLNVEDPTTAQPAHASQAPVDTSAQEPSRDQPASNAQTKNNSEITEPSEPDIEPQQHLTEPEVSPTELEVSRTEPGSVPSELSSVSGEPAEPNYSADLDQQFAEALKQIPEGYHEIAADLYESIHRRSKFAKLTSTQRHAIYELNKSWKTESVLGIIAMPPPIGIGFSASLAGLKRFLQDYRRILRDEQDIQSDCKTEEEHLASEQSFETANTSDESFHEATERQIRKRLYTAASNPNSD